MPRSAKKKKQADADHPLYGVVAFIDVHCEGAESKAVIQSKIQELGGRVVASFSKTVTHVVFKDGKKSTLSKAVARPEVRLVSVMWVEECSKQRQRVDEAPFLVDPETTPPASKRSKSMKPQAIGSTATSAQSTPKAPASKVLCEDTQAFDDDDDDDDDDEQVGDSAAATKATTTTGGGKAAPSTAASVVVPESPMASGVPATPAHGNGSNGGVDEEEHASPAIPRQPSLVFDSPNMEDSSNLANAEEEQEKGEEQAGNGNDSGEAAATGQQQQQQEEKDEGKGSKKTPVKRKLLSRKKKDATAATKQQQQGGGGAEEGEEADGSEHKAASAGEGSGGDEDRKEQEGKPSKPSKLKDVTNSNSNKAKAKMATKKKSVTDGHSDGNDNGDDEEQQDDDANKAGNNKSKKTKAAANTAPRKKRKILGHVVLSGLDAADLDVAYATIEALGGFDILPAFSDEVTHVVSGGKRTLKVLEGITRGCWVVSMDWIHGSMQAGHWLDEDQFELADTFPGVAISRQRRQGLAASATTSPLFPKNVTVYIGAQTSPNRQFLQSLVTRSGGQLSRSAPAASIVVGRPGCKGGPDAVRGKEVVSEKWLLDCITQQAPVPTDKYSVDVEKLMAEPWVAPAPDQGADVLAHLEGMDEQPDNANGEGDDDDDDKDDGDAALSGGDDDEDDDDDEDEDGKKMKMKKKKKAPASPKMKKPQPQTAKPKPTGVPAVKAVAAA
ncbi:hypothetical protein PTSG_10361 [Salpingoeca rosetta]|uniref:BRCT domain-containing protein n=1 Tax=Salpingoeca rosetta (strain ATCC 50818 / BSB-021) TaxID=946362 RepID=F2UR32_SALR5|nr:uncharacterized protein PTSG_10361 [Salpingoeca rosetta]EGD80087.1 hypothetical protein PTSG_10361 [Salpingoeca rosetta]|eukprot:XP_004988412.1 hypothetical protein PTSG_10361 [Salpingoeca rosetta]